MPSKRSFRRRVHLFAYGFVSFCSIVLGIVFTGYALFERQSVISKVWLAGPTTLAVGLVLCGKVIIDCNPDSENESEEANDNNNNNVVDVSISEKVSHNPRSKQIANRLMLLCYYFFRFRACFFHSRMKHA